MTSPSQASRDAELRIALSLARAAVAALKRISPETAGQVRAELRKEAVSLDLKPEACDKAAAAAIRRILDADG